MWLISLPLLGAQYFGQNNPLGFLDFAGIVFWLIGFTFEAGGDFQLAIFKADPANKEKVLDTGFWRYTRHPNYLETPLYGGIRLICLSAASYFPVIGSILMTALIIKVFSVLHFLKKALKNRNRNIKITLKGPALSFPGFQKNPEEGFNLPQSR